MPARASCDACYTKRQKCTRTDSGCERCDKSARELVCKYSPDLPKKSNHRKSDHKTSDHKTSDHKKSDHSHVEDSQTSQSPSSREPTLLHDFRYAGPTLNQENYAPAADSLPNFDWQAYSIGFNAEPNPFFSQYLPQGSIGIPQDPNPWPASIGTTSTTATTPALTDAASPDTAISTTFSPPSTNQPRTNDTQAFRHYPSAAPATPVQQRIFAKAPCSCFPHLSEAMQRINALATRHSPPKLDAVLDANRTAAQQCLTSLQCSRPFATAPQSGVSSCAIIACGLLDRILASYPAAIEAFCASFDGKGPEDHGDKMSAERGHDDGERTSERTKSVQVRIGDFAPEGSEQVLLARRMVAVEAEKIYGVLKGFRSVAAGPHVHSGMLAHLMKRCQEVVAEVWAC